jgi:hypothetical protein
MSAPLILGCVTGDQKQIFARELDEFLADYPDWLLEMPDGSLAPVAHMTRETRSGDAVIWIVHSAEDPSRRIECVQADELLTFKRERDSSP